MSRALLSSQHIAVIVPAFNEEHHIAAMLRGLPSYVDRILVVDDASHDGTVACVERIAAQDTRVVLHRHGRNRGVGAALKTGYRAALLEGTDVAVVMAGDGQMDPADLRALLEPVLSGQADYAKGDRLAHPEVGAAMPWTRRLGNRVLSWATRRALGVPVRDSQCGYTALSARRLAALPLEPLWEGYGYPNDVLARLALDGARICDVVVRPVYAGETSGVRLRHALAIVPFVIARAFARRVAVGVVRGLTRLRPEARAHHATVRARLRTAQLKSD